MENNGDKEMRDKLNSTEFPFDPQAWEKMETMLDGKKKRRVFFWWWTGGIAAALLFGMVGYELRGLVNSEANKGVTENTNLTAVEIAKSKGQNSNSNTEINISTGEGKTTVEDKHPGSKENSKSTSNKKNLETGIGKTENTRDQLANEGNKPLAKKTSAPRSGNFNKQSSEQHVTTNKQKSKIKNQKLAPPANEETTNAQLSAEKNPFKKEIEMLAVASGKTSMEEGISLNRREASLLEYASEKEVPSFDKKTDADAIPKQKKKIFNYSLGVLGNVTGSSVGTQVGIPGQSTAPYFFYHQPSYMVGFTHDFLFVSRVAITNSILFSQTSFEVYQAKTTGFSYSPSVYASHITELDIPIGIKVYPVVKNNFRFYINTGIINHIKLKETFDYTMLDDTVFNASANFTDHAVFPDQTTFGPKTSTALGQGLSANDYGTKDFSINKASRYYASFYASAGFEFIAKKHFVLFGEPMFYMSLQKIGVQDRRKYNLGLTSGFRYQF